MATITELITDPKEALHGKHASVVIFYAPWCGDCKTSEEIEKKLAEEFAGKVEFFRFDAANYDEIADTYGIERYPTYVFFKKHHATKGILVEPMSEGEVRNWLEIKVFGGVRQPRR